MTTKYEESNYYVKNDENVENSSFPTWAKVLSIIIGISIIGFIAFNIYMSQNSEKKNDSVTMTTEQEKPKRNVELGTSGVASQGNTIKEMAEEKGIDLSQINHDTKTVNVDNNKIVSSVTPLSITINEPAKLINGTGECSLDGEYSFCYISEVEVDKKKVATILAFSDIFNTKFFSVLTEVEHINIGASPMSFVSKLDNSEGNDAIFVSDLNGTGFVFLMEPGENADSIIADIEYS